MKLINLTVICVLFTVFVLSAPACKKKQPVKNDISEVPEGVILRVDDFMHHDTFLVIDEEGKEHKMTWDRFKQPLPNFFIIRDGQIHAVTGDMVQLPTEPPEEQ